MTRTIKRLSEESAESLRARAQEAYDEGWIGSGKYQHMLNVADVREEVQESLDSALMRDTDREADLSIPVSREHALVGPPRWRGL